MTMRDSGLKYHNIIKFSKFFKPHLSLFVQAISGTVAINILALSIPLFMKILVDNIIPFDNTGLLNAMIIGLVILLIFKTVFGLFKAWIMIIVGLKIKSDISYRFYRHLQSLSLQFYEKEKLGDMQSRLVDINIIQSSVTEVILSAVTDGLAVILFAGVLLYLNWLLALFSFIFAPVLILTIIFFAEPLRRGSEKVMAARAEYMSFVYESLSGLRTIKALNITTKFSRLAHKRLLIMNREQFKLFILSFFSFSIGEFVRMAGSILILWFGANLVIKGSLTLGGLLFYALLDYLMGPLYNLTEFNANVQRALAATQRFYEVYDTKPSVQDSPYAVELPQKIKGTIEFKDIYFSYNGKDDVLKEISFQISPGTVTSVIGKSGSGKTTLCNLIIRFYDPYMGSIFIDDHDIKDVRLKDLCRHISLIPQEPFLFNGTIKENILIADNKMSARDMVEASKIADIHDFIMTLPEKYDTIIGERGVNLSGGQKQRLVIARTILRNPSVLILDEATSSVDVQSERLIHNALTEMFGKITIIIVTHRLSSIRNVDNIIVLDKGRIAEIGKHDDLISRRKIYYEMNRETNMPFL